MSEVRKRKSVKDDVAKKVGSSRKNENTSTFSTLKTPLIFLVLGLTALYLSPYKIQLVAKDSTPVSTEEGIQVYFNLKS